MKTNQEERRTKGTGRIWFDDRQGVYKGRIRIGGKDKYLTLTANKRESESLWKEFIERERPAAKMASAKLPLSEVWPKVRAAVEATNAKLNQDRYFVEWSALRSWLEARGVKYMEDVTSTQFADYFNAWAVGRSPATRNILLSRFRKIWAEALPNQPTSENPTRTLALTARTPESREPLTDAEISSLLAAAKEKGEEWHRLIVIGLNTGLRLKDCVLLTSDKVRNGVISTVPFKTAKKSGKRVNIPMNAALHEVLDGVEGAFCPHLRDRYLNNISSFATSLKGLFRKAGIETSRKVEGYAHAVSVKGFHALRATFITRLSEAGVSLGLIQSMAGHVDSVQTLAYTHPNQTALQAAVDSLPQFDGKAVASAKYVSADASTIADTTANKVLDALRRMGLAAEDDSDFSARLAPITAKLEKVEGMSAVEKNAACIGAAFALAEVMGIPSTLSA